MAARRTRESGQSLIEFVLILPVVVGMLFVMVRVSSSIQVSIVNQKYARQRVFEIADNAAYFPRLERLDSQFIPKLTNRMVIGVSDELTNTGDSFVPKASTQRITRNARASQGSNEDQKEPDARGLVRIRNTVELCAPVRVARIGGSTPKKITSSDLREGSMDRVLYCRSGSNE